MATVTLRDLVVEAKHGVLDHEKTQTQPFKIHLELQYDSLKAQTSDNINDAIDYSVIRQQVIDTTKNTSFDLLERLAQEIADTVLKDSRIETLAVSIEKPTIFESGTPGVTLTFSRP